MKNSVWFAGTALTVMVAAVRTAAIGIPRGLLNDSIIEETCSQQFPQSPAQFRSCQEFLEDVRQGNKEAYELYKTIVTPFDQRQLFLRGGMPLGVYR